MTTDALVSIICLGHAGFVFAISGQLSDTGINLGDTTFALLGSVPEFIAVW